MSQKLSTEFVRTTIRHLLQTTDQCVRAEEEADRTFAENAAQTDAAFTRCRGEWQKKWTVEQEATRKSFADRIEKCESECAAAEQAADQEFAATTSEITQQYERDEGAANKEFQESNWTLEAVCDSQKKQAHEKFENARRLFADQRATIKRINESVTERLNAWGHIPVAAPGSVSVNVSTSAAAQESASRIESARAQVAKLERLVAPRLLIGDRLLFIGIVLAAVCVTGLAAIFHWGADWGLGPILLFSVVGGLALAAAFTFAAKWVLAKHARKKVAATCVPLRRALAEAEAICSKGEEFAQTDYNDSASSEKQNFQKQLLIAAKLQREKLAQALENRDAIARSTVQKRDSAKAAIQKRCEQETKKLKTELKETLANLETRFAGELENATTDYQQRRESIQQTFDASFEKLANEWRAQHAELSANLATIAEQNDKYCPDWSAPSWNHWKPSKMVPPAVRFGSLAVELPRLPTHERLPKPPALVAMPALLPFPNQSSTVFHAAGVARDRAAQALLSASFRFLTSLPPGKVRLSIIDPVGLGENFASLMLLADHDPQLVGARIWTEPPQIEKRLADLTAHMENVIQKYLRSQYASIEEYNVQAGEVAEPYRVLVVANFPANFTTESARRLERIAANGASCGVYTLVGYDPSLPLPQSFDPENLLQASTNLRWKNDRFVWQDNELSNFPLTVDSPPENEVLAKTLQKIGVVSKDANRVEVDFEFIAPPADERWKADSRTGIDVPLGRAGATKRQHLQLGKGTAQHAIVAGKTGSGKSTLLHALITNLALTYGPDEIELYLIDFKKGVEFKTYANHKLPHARVIAVESEREFGLSVLQRLDQELKRRGDLFRTASVQDLKGYRETHGGPASKMPRILFIVDEFQEFFVEDDRVAQEAALLLDRLVRQGRAFGLHVLLGSQTLGGAYSLARSTIDQMAVRIALQCSEADAGLILSKDNNAARLLSRPGEAIYNDANGLIEGNDIFQVVWLPDERRERYLTAIREAANKQGFEPPAPMVVFEGNIPSDITKDNWFLAMLDKPRPTTAPRELVCRLGDAMAIKEPTAAVFRRQSASNLLIFGQQPDPARAILTAIGVAVAAQSPRGDAPNVLFLDGTPADDPHFGNFAESFVGFDGVSVMNGRESSEAMKLVADEYERRIADPGKAAPPLLLAVYAMHRIKDLRKPEDDFGFRKSEGEPSPAQRFATAVREGPAVGIHVVAWCDTLVNAQRAMERAMFREFEMKVLFQMGANDSSTLIDSPHASRLGVNRALFAHEELTAPEKFRPFSLPPDEWMKKVREKMKANVGT